MINEEVLAAVKSGRFHIIGVDSIVDAMEILTGQSWDKEQLSIRANILATLKHFNRLRSEPKKRFKGVHSQRQNRFF